MEKFNYEAISRSIDLSGYPVTLVNSNKPYSVVEGANTAGNNIKRGHINVALTEEYIREYHNNQVDIYILSMYQELSWSFIKEFKKWICWSSLILTTPKSVEDWAILYEFRDMIDWKMFTFFDYDLILELDEKPWWLDYIDRDIAQLWSEKAEARDYYYKLRWSLDDNLKLKNVARYNKEPREDIIAARKSFICNEFKEI